MAITVENLTTTQTQYLLGTYYDKVLLERLIPQTRFYEHATKKPLPKGEGKVVKWSAYKNAPEGSSLTEGTIPTATPLSTFNVTATLVQKGMYTSVSDLLVLTAIDDNIKSAAEILSDSLAKTIDSYIRTQCMGTTGIPAGAGFALKWSNANSAGAGSLSALTSGAALTVAEVRKLVEDLDSQDVPPMADGYYVGIAHPRALAQLRSDSEWQSWKQYTTPEAMYRGEVGEVEQVRFVKSTNTTWTTSGTAAPGTTSAFFTLICGRGAYGVTEIDGSAKKGAGIIVKTPGPNDTSNPLNQYSTVGYKATFASAINFSRLVGRPTMKNLAICGKLRVSESPYKGTIFQCGQSAGKSFMTPQRLHAEHLEKDDDIVRAA